MKSTMKQFLKYYIAANTFVEIHHVFLYCLVIIIVGFLTFMESFDTPCRSVNPSLTNKGANTWRHAEEQYGMNDDQLLQYLYFQEIGTTDSLWNITGAVACIVICISAILDTILDLLPIRVLNLFYSDERPQWKPISTEILRFTHLERMIMVTGIIINPIQIMINAHSPPTVSVSNTIMLRKAAHLLADCTLFSELLMTIPVLMLMTRLSHVWSRLLPFSILIVLGIATIAARARYTTSIGGVCISYNQFLSLQATDSACHIIALILAFSGGLMCFGHYVLMDARSSQKRVSSQAAAEKNFRILVIGAHLTIFVMSLLTYVTRLIFVPDQNAHAKSRYSVFGVGLLVFMVESRLRKNEVNRALYAAIEVKKRYARFLERELRAPLSMALLGVRLLKDRLKHADEEMNNTLNDVLGSYVMVSNAIGGFVQFETLDLLERNAGASLPSRQMVLVVPFLHEVVGIFGPEISKKQITMSVDMNGIEKLSTLDNDKKQHTSVSHFVDPEQWNHEIYEKVTPLDDADLIHISRTPLSQALRSLFAHVVGRTNDGGAIRVGACFVPGRHVMTTDPLLLHQSSDTMAPRDQNNFIQRLWSCLNMQKRDSTHATEELPTYDRYNFENDIEQRNHVMTTDGPTVRDPDTMSQHNNSTKADDISGALIIQIIHTGVNITSEELDNLFFLDTDSRQKNDTTAVTGSEDERGIGAWAARTVVELLKGSVAVYPMKIGPCPSSSGAVFVLELPMIRMASVHKSNFTVGGGPSIGDFRQGLTPIPLNTSKLQDSYPSSYQESKEQSQLRYLSTKLNNADDLVLAVMSKIPPQQPQPRVVMAPIEEGSIARSSKVLSFSESGSNPIVL